MNQFRDNTNATDMQKVYFLNNFPIPLMDRYTYEIDKEIYKTWH